MKGFELRVGGGTSIMPRVAPTLNEFVTADDGEYLKWAEAVFRIFDRQDWLRVNRARARIKVLVDKVGIDEVRRMVDEELEGDWVAERDFSIEDRVFLHDEEADAPERAARLRLAQRRPQPRSTASCDANVEPQRQEGFSTVQVKVTRGDLTPEQFRGLAADHARVLAAATPARPCTRTSCCAGCATRRSTTSGSACSALGLGDAGADEINDVVSCPGTDSCKLGITSSMGLNRAVQERIESMGITDPLTRRIHIKMSGCPNGCSQHHIGNIGFYGASIKVGEHTIPAYVAHIGGNYEGGEIVYGARLKVRLASKRVPGGRRALDPLLRGRARGRARSSTPSPTRVGTKAFEDRVRDLAMPIEFGLETMENFIDWTKNVPFQVVRGEGECAVVSPPPRAARGGGHPRHPRGRGRAREARRCCSAAARTRSSCCALAEKAFAPAPLPFAVMHVDTGHNFPEAIEFRDRRVPDAIVASVQESIDKGRVVEETGPRASRNRLQTTTLLDAIAEHGFDAAFGGARRDEERARAKERVFSFRDDFGQWDPRKQRPELWDLYNGRVRRGEHVRVFPLSNWTELDVWEYILAEELEIPGLYVAHEREVFERDGMLYAVSRLRRAHGRRGAVHRVGALPHRRRHDAAPAPCARAPRRSTTSSAEIAATRVTERGETRADDRVSEAAMEDRKRVGYF